MFPCNPVSITMHFLIGCDYFLFDCGASAILKIINPIQTISNVHNIYSNVISQRRASLA